MGAPAQSASPSGHDWLDVGSTAKWPSFVVRRWPKTGRSFIRVERRLRESAGAVADAVGRGAAAGWQAASLLLSRLRHGAPPVLHSLGRLDPSELASRVCARLRLPLVPLRRLAWAAAALSCLFILALGYLATCVAGLPFNGGLTIEPTPAALTVEANGGEVFASRGVFKGANLAPADLPPQLAQAVIAIEDRHFYQHGGLYVPSILRAAWHDALDGGAREGGSTITQQLARMMYLSPERTLKRKLQEAMLALWLERQLSKEEILTRYLNTAYFGAGVYGADAAARRYFGKAAKDLSLGEAAMLAGLVRAPSLLAPNRNLDGARQRAGLVLDAMVKTGAISREQADAARREPAVLRVPPESPPGTNYFVDTLAGEVKRLLGSVSSDLTLRTTLDLDLQRLAENVVAGRLKAEGRAKNVGQAALIAMAPDGAILAMVGGRDYTESQFNRATQARRQPGSLFKLFVYLAAFEKGANPQAMAVDRPVAIGNWEPENYGGRFRGPVPLRTAFASSINSVAVQLADAIGIGSVIETAHRLGVASDLPAVPSLALGSAEVTLLEMTRAFAAIAANAETIEPYGVRSIKMRDQLLFSRPKPVPQPPANPAARAAIRDFLAAVVREGTGRAAAINIPVAGKTGTSQDNRDAWFIGFTPDLVVGVWVGNDDNSPTRGVVGGDLPARIWREFVTQAGAARAKQAASRAAAAPASATDGVKAEPEAIRGRAMVVDTATIELQGRRLRLYGVQGTRGQPAREFRRYLGRREVACTPAGGNGEYRCRVDDIDLSRAVLFNGGGRASANAPPELKALEATARTARIGVWGEEDDDD
jgi:1A family penicillin-binding protein